MKSHLLILAVLGFGASIASAQRGMPPAGGHPRPPVVRPPLPEFLTRYDLNNDGVLSAGEITAMRAAIRAEMDARRAEFIAKYDGNGDGVLDAAEREAARTSIAAEMETARIAALTVKFNALDSDSSAGISATEWAAGAPAGSPAARVAAAFAKLDKDSDGTITLAEFTVKPVRPAPGHGRGR